MKVLALTWEFPPFISGGLGMACYGLIKSLLELGISVDMILPSSEEVYFPLRSPADVDLLPFEYLDKSHPPPPMAVSYENVTERLQSIGVSMFPESYLTPAFTEQWVSFFNSSFIRSTGQTEILRSAVSGEESLFRKVQEYTLRVFKAAKHLSFDVIHAHDWLTYPAGVLLKQVTGKPLVTHMHATEFDRAGGTGDERIHRIEYTGLTTADRVIAVSKYTAQMVIDRYRVQPEKIRTVYNAYSISSEESGERKRLFKDPLVLFLGRLTIQKGPDYFLEVAQRVLNVYPKVRFVVAGTGDMFSRLLWLSASRRMKDRFLFSGFLNRKQVKSILLATDIFVLTSVSEPFGIAPLEAMAAGAAVIISKQSGVSEVIQSAYKIDFWDIDKITDSLLFLLKNPEERNALSRAGQQEVLAIGWKEAGEKVVQIFNELVCST